MRIRQWPPGHRPFVNGVCLVAPLLVASLLAGCGEGKSAAEKKAPPPPPAVVVAEVVQRTVPIRSEFVARTDAQDTVEIRARVQAFLEGQHFTEGTMVKKDQVLFTLDKREYEAQLKQGRNWPKPRPIWPLRRSRRPSTRPRPIWMWPARS
jgi:multidrug efflux pump subunit AcrA (membrane-fusion protein)